jgi:hypothetical protein
MRFELRAGLGGVDATAWDDLGAEDDPFADHAFLRALETSGSVGGESGWSPLHVLVWDGARLVGALPLYVKAHSYGEYIFDWSWASAAGRAGIRYYPKLVGMAPFTPATGSRLLCRADADRAEVVAEVVQGIFAAQKDVGASSVHLLFLREDERDLFLSGGLFVPRLSSQFHWRNEGYATFDDFLARFRSVLRKQVHRERRRVRESGVEIRVIEGDRLGDAEWNALAGFYFATCLRRGSGPYLTREFFEVLRHTCAHRVVAALAYRGSVPVAGTLNFEKGRHLYGRYWGSSEEQPGLHFELCYYRLIERAIERKLARFEAGAQGIHKLRRGLMPIEVHSVHWVGDPALARAVREFLPREAAAVREEIAALAMHGPFRRS